MKNQFAGPARYFPFIIFLILAFTGCKKKQPENPVAIGKEYQGGTIFYIDNTGKHGLVATKLNPGFVTQGWGCYWTDIPSTNAAFGTGQSNTEAILANCTEPNIMARLCDNLTVGGYDDWFMPSKDELQLIYTNLHQMGFGGFENHPYWSSTEHTPHYAWEINFGTGLADRGSKGNSYQKGIAVREF